AGRPPGSWSSRRRHTRWERKRRLAKEILTRARVGGKEKRKNTEGGGRADAVPRAGDSLAIETRAEMWPGRRPIPARGSGSMSPHPGVVVESRSPDRLHYRPIQYGPSELQRAAGPRSKENVHEKGSRARKHALAALRRRRLLVRRPREAHQGSDRNHARRGRNARHRQDPGQYRGRRRPEVRQNAHRRGPEEGRK